MYKSRPVQLPIHTLFRFGFVKFNCYLNNVTALLRSLQNSIYIYIYIYINQDVSNFYILCYIVLLGRLLKCYKNLIQVARAVAQAVSLWLPIAAAWVRVRVRSCGICGGQNALGRDFSVYFGFPCQAFHRGHHSHHRLSSGAGTIGQ
jgi:hypothetical protein